MTTFNKIDNATIHDMQIAANLKDFLAALQVIAPTRIRGLGEQRAMLFVEHSLHWGNEFNLLFRDQVIYLMFIMNFLGSYFWTDPRFVQFAEILEDQDATGHQKTDALHRAFSAFSDRFIGEDYGLYWDTIDRTEKRILNVISDDHKTDEDVLQVQISCHQINDLDENFPMHQFIFASRQAARIMRMDSEKGYKTSVVLCYWFGTSYFADPLFPWIKDIAGQEKTPDKKATALMDYAMKRLDKARLMRPKKDTENV